jgi:hypothetical protein
LQHRQRHATVRSRCIDGNICCCLEARDAIRCLIPLGKSRSPLSGHLRGVLFHREIAAHRFARIDPVCEVLRRQFRKRQHQSPQVALGVDADRGIAIDGGFFQQGQAQAGLAAAGHADAYRVRGQIARVVQQRIG